MTARLVVEVPGNPWAGAINRRDRAAVSSRGKPYNRKQAGFKAYQAEVALWARMAARAQGWLRLTVEAEVWITLWVPDRRRRDIDGPIKAILDGMTDGGVWVDDSQVWAKHDRKAIGKPRARIVVRPWVDPAASGVLDGVS